MILWGDSCSHTHTALYVWLHVTCLTYIGIHTWTWFWLLSPKHEDNSLPPWDPSLADFSEALPSQGRDPSKTWLGDPLGNSTEFCNYSHSGPFEIQNFHRNFIFPIVKCVPANLEHVPTGSESSPAIDSSNFMNWKTFPPFFKSRCRYGGNQRWLDVGMAGLALSRCRYGGNRFQ
jgi:hypothetical protein